MIAVGSVWIGLTLAYVFPTLPPSSTVIAVAVGAYVATLGAGAVRDPRAAWRRLVETPEPEHGHVH